MVQHEQTKANKYGGEQWEANRAIDKEEQPVISHNTLLNLPERTAIAYMPGWIASKLYACHTQVDNSVASWKKPEEDTTMVAWQPGGSPGAYAPGAWRRRRCTWFGTGTAGAESGEPHTSVSAMAASDGHRQKYPAPHASCTIVRLATTMASSVLLEYE